MKCAYLSFLISPCYLNATIFPLDPITPPTILINPLLVLGFVDENPRPYASSSIFSLKISSFQQLCRLPGFCLWSSQSTLFPKWDSAVGTFFIHNWRPKFKKYYSMTQEHSSSKWIDNKTIWRVMREIWKIKADVNSWSVSSSVGISVGQGLNVL